MTEQDLAALEQRFLRHNLSYAALAFDPLTGEEIAQVLALIEEHRREKRLGQAKWDALAEVTQENLKLQKRMATLIIHHRNSR